MNIQPLLSSASKIVLLMISLTLCAGVLVGKLTEDTFKLGMVAVFTFYFTHKSASSTDSTYGGK